MKKIFLVLLIVFQSNVWSKSYYFSNDGKDSNAGTTESSPWKSISKFNQFKFSENDNVFFHKGDIFYGTLKIQESNITIGSYGSGHQPVFSGEKNLTSQWVKLSDDMWQYTFNTDKPKEIRGLIANDDLLPISRMPNKEENGGYFSMDNVNGNNNFSSKNLQNKNNLSGYEIVIRAERYRQIRTKILNSNGNNITIADIASVKELHKGFGFFIVNNKNAIDKEGEWAYEFNTGIIFLKSKKDPNINKINYSNALYNVDITGSTNLILKDVELKYASKSGVNISNSNNITIDNVLISNSIGNGINLSKVTNSKITNNKIFNIAWTGVFADKSNKKIVISNNSIRNIGNESFAKTKAYIGIDCNASFSNIQNNVIKNTGYSGIISAGNDNLIKYNIVDSTCVLLNDNGGIYINNNINDVGGTIIEKNFVSNTIGELEGAPSTRNLANGIYLDVGSHDIIVRNNTVFNIKGSGLFINYTKGNNTISNNIIYNCGLSEFYIAGHPDSAPKLNVNSNIFASSQKSSKSHKIFNSVYTRKYDTADIAILKGNFFISSYNAKELDVTFSAKDKSKSVVDFGEWIKEINGSKNSEGNSFINASDLTLLSNPSNNNKNIKIADGTYYDVNGKSFSKEIELEPFQSVILFKKIN